MLLEDLACPASLFLAFKCVEVPKALGIGIEMSCLSMQIARLRCK